MAVEFHHQSWKIGKFTFFDLFFIWTRRIREVPYTNPEALEILEDANMTMVFFIKAADSLDVSGMIIPRTM